MLYCIYSFSPSGGVFLAKRGGRIYFLDEFRAAALIGMIVYHAAYDLYAIFGVKFNFYSPFWNGLQLFVCCSFIVIAGISARLTKSALKHGAVVFSAGLLMTLGTYIFMPDLVIWFGVLHFLGISMMLYYLFRKPIGKAPAIIFGAISLLLFFCLRGLSSGTVLFGRVAVPKELYFTKWLAPIGLPGPGFSSADYFPLIPWFFLFLFGCFIGKYFKERRIPDFMMKKHSDFLCRIGSNTLIIYILHQPVTYALLYMVFWLLEKGGAI